MGYVEPTYRMLLQGVNGGGFRIVYYLGLSIWKWWKHQICRLLLYTGLVEIGIELYTGYCVLSHEICQWGLVRMLDAWQCSVACESRVSLVHMQM